MLSNRTTQAPPGYLSYFLHCLPAIWQIGKSEFLNNVYLVKQFGIIRTILATTHFISLANVQQNILMFDVFSETSNRLI